MAGSSHRNLSREKVARELAHFSAAGRSEESRRPLGEGKSFCSLSFAECYQSSRHKFSVESPASGLQTHPHSSTNRLCVRSAPAQPLIVTIGRAFRNLVFPRCPAECHYKVGYGAIRSVSVS